MKKRHILLVGCTLSLPFWAVGSPIIEESPVAMESSEAVTAAKAVEPRVVILNNQNQQNDQKSAQDQGASVSNQPVVRVMGTPVSMTYAAELKKSREEAELKTEQKIVEKLESSRLRDEQERLNKLFNQKPKADSIDKLVVMPTSHTALHGSVTAPAEEESDEKLYAGFQAGQSSNLTTVKNLDSYGSFGASMGVISNAGLILESSFFYSQHQLDLSQKYNNNLGNIGVEDIADVYQLTGLLALKYAPFSSRFKPYVGVFMAYNYWMYNIADSHCSYSSVYCRQETQKADSVDIGPIVGIDVQLNHKVSIGFNIMISAQNLYNNRANDSYEDYSYYNNYYTTYNQERYIHLEETHWLIASLNAKLYF